MADKKNYYYLKIKENFFDSEDMKLLETMDNGYIYSNILMKMYLLSLKNNGRLMYKDKIPYNSKMLSTILNHNVDILEKAIEVFKKLNLIEVMDTGAIFMLDIQNFIGKSSDEADRKRAFRNQIESERTNVGQLSGQITPILEIELDLEKDIEKQRTENREEIRNNKKENIKRKNFVKPTIEELTSYCLENNYNIDCNYFIDYYESKGWIVGKTPMKDWKATIRNWSRKNIDNNNTKKESRNFL